MTNDQEEGKRVTEDENYFKAEKTLRFAAEVIDEAKAADDDGPLFDERARLLFCGLALMMLDTDGVDALFHDKPNADHVAKDVFWRAVYETTASRRDGIAHAARLLFLEAAEFVSMKRGLADWISFDEFISLRHRLRANEQGPI